MKNVLETLTEAREPIADRDDWKQQGLCEMGAGEAVGPFCSLGAIGKVSRIFSAQVGGSSNRDGRGQGGIACLWQEENAKNAAARRVYDEATMLLSSCLEGTVHEFNDSHSHECVLAAFDAAIESLEA
jgi:hypothetical protein